MPNAVKKPRATAPLTPAQAKRKTEAQRKRREAQRAEKARLAKRAELSKTLLGRVQLWFTDLFS